MVDVALTPDTTSVGPNGSEVSKSFNSDDYGGSGTLYYKLSGDGSPDVSLQASYDGGDSWFDVILLESQNKIKSTALEGALAMPNSDRHAPLLRLKIAESGGSNSLTIEEVRAYSPQH